MLNKNLVLDNEPINLLNMLQPKNTNKFIREAIKEKARRELDLQMIEGYKARCAENNTGISQEFSAIDLEGWTDDDC